MPSENTVEIYSESIKRELATGNAREHTYRTALKLLVQSLNDVHAANEEARSAYGAPDFVFRQASNLNIVLGYAETKDVDKDLDKIIKTEQLQRYAGYNKLFLTNYLEFRFYLNGDEYERITIGKIRGHSIEFNHDEFSRLINELQAFLDLPPVEIRNGKKLAQIMGARARRIRDNVERYLGTEDDKNDELENIYQLIKKSLVHDLTPAKFADMYAQTLVYGLFAARYNDKTPDDFSRQEARDLVPRTNPFLHQFFDHIAGANFDTRLAHIVDELCDVFAVSDVHMLVQKHLRLFEVENDKDPIIHFYEDFLKEYDPAVRKAMGAYYTPVPVVRYIIRQVDRILKEDFGLLDGLADTAKITKHIETGQDTRKTRNHKLTTIQEKAFHKVQVLDPAVGTATFLNEIVKFVAKGFAGQEGRWEAYVNDDLLPRLSGFELMMAPYTVAHLKLGMTLQESGAKHLRERLGIYLTNTLEEGIPGQQDLFSVGLQAAVTEESRLASEVKHDRPVMIVIGNPPYSVSSNNKSNYIQNLIKDYKRDLNERKINLDDDYIKFIRFAQDMIAKNGEGIVAMITNNSYIDGITHRQMRKHLLQTFDKIYILDLHGNSKKKETTPSGDTDQNVFDIMQGVGIILAVKTGAKAERELGEIHHAELFGTRRSKFDELDRDEPAFSPITYTAPNYFFVPKDDSLLDDYQSGVSLDDLFINKASGFRSGDDKHQVTWTKAEVERVVEDLINLSEQDFRHKYQLKDGRNHHYKGMRADVGDVVDPHRVIATLYRPFDIRFTYYSEKSSGFVAWPRSHTTRNFLRGANISLIYKRGYIEEKAAPIGISNLISHERTWSRAGMQGADTLAPLYIYHDDGTKTPNFDQKELKRLVANLSIEPLPEEVLDYIYAILHSPSYRAKYKEFLKTDFPRVPVPSQADFERLVPLGRELRELHLIKSPLLQAVSTTFPETGSNEVEQIKYENDRIYINSTQYFGNAPQTVWDFYIGGYQPAQKWLKDRKGRVLTNADLTHYQQIIKALAETDRIIRQIDKA